MAMLMMIMMPNTKGVHCVDGNDDRDEMHCFGKWKKVLGVLDLLGPRQHTLARFRLRDVLTYSGGPTYNEVKPSGYNYW